MMSYIHVNFRSYSINMYTYLWWKTVSLVAMQHQWENGWKDGQGVFYSCNVVIFSLDKNTITNLLALYNYTKKNHLRAPQITTRFLPVAMWLFYDICINSHGSKSRCIPKEVEGLTYHNGITRCFTSTARG